MSAPVEPTVVGGPRTLEPEPGWERTVARDIVVGQSLGDYKVVRRLGAGGMGIVYEGVHSKIGRRVAIKVLRPSLARDPKQVESLLEEARSANAVRHRAIIDIYDFGSLPGVGHYLVMEYLEGKSLEDALEQGPLPPLEAVQICIQVADALGAAHEAHLVHRDLKPSNIFQVVEPGGGRYVKVLDFGIAKRVPPGKEQTRVERVVGTPEYMSPEQAQGLAVGPPSDLYALGCILYELLAGKPPFTGEGMAVATSHVVDEVPDLLERAPHVPPRLAELVHRLLEKDPADRPASAREVRTELQQIARELADPATKMAPRLTTPSARGGKSAEDRPAPRRARAATDHDDVPEIPLPKRSPLWIPLALVGVVVAIGAFAFRSAFTSGGARGTPIDARPNAPGASPEARSDPEAPAVDPDTTPVLLQPEDESPPEENKEPDTGHNAAEVAASPRHTPMGSGTLAVDVKGAYVEILIDGKVRGQTPWEKSLQVSAGRHRVELRALPGDENPIQPYRTTVTIRDDQRTPLRLERDGERLKPRR
ncbi:MAG: serine/threonine protein kinase [Myxococcaceae bacterium]|nr:serine/threonine protein kinase [Myxococcaceae bacterium]